jgi:hypothetical protein
LGGTVVKAFHGEAFLLCQPVYAFMMKDLSDVILDFCGKMKKRKIHGVIPEENHQFFPATVRA